MSTNISAGVDLPCIGILSTSISAGIGNFPCFPTIFLILILCSKGFNANTIQWPSRCYYLIKSELATVILYTEYILRVATFPHAMFHCHWVNALHLQ